MNNLKSLRAPDLYRQCDPQAFDFTTTADLQDVTEFIGQPRAVEAMRFGVGIAQQGYNIFALGPAGTGKRSFVRSFFEQQALGEPKPSDWLYVNNFEQPHKPHAISLPAGKGSALRKDMEQLVDGLRTALSAAFDSEEYQTRRQAIGEEFKERQADVFRALQRQAEGAQVAVVRTPAGLVIAPARDGEVLSPDDIQKMPEDQQKELSARIEAIQEEVEKILRQMPAWQREMQEKAERLNREMAEFAVGGQIAELCERYIDSPQVVRYLEAVQEDVVENARDFLSSDGQGGGNALRRPEGAPHAFRRYQVNLLVDHGDSPTAPVVYEDNPTYQNLVGRVEYVAQMGALVTDFNLIKPGALHRANGGYLLLDARKVLLQPYAWEGLKRALESGQIRIESLMQMLSLISTVSLEPEPIPLRVRVALLGDRLLYYLLYQLDPDFGELFKVMADFEELMARDSQSQQVYARLIATLVRREGLHAFDRAAVARVIERSARLAGDAEKLMVRMRPMVDLLREADYWAGQVGRDVVTAADVRAAIDAQIRRADRLRERLQEEIVRDTILIDTQGEKVGQVNGLSVYQLGEFAFGQPTRITATIRLGKGEVVDIEREVELGGPIHSKGVMILAGFLGARYAAEQPLSLSASLVFEQSYGGVEGDSASSAELYALLSAIAGAPIRQSLAVTGSVNQLGQVQAIGGVNEKIEGFFDLCRARGLTGEQGVLIPKANVKHLMLREDVVEAVEAGQFHVYPVETIDQGAEVLTGVAAGERGADGSYPEGSLNRRVEQRLADLARKRQEYSAAGKEGEA